MEFNILTVMFLLFWCFMTGLVVESVKFSFDGDLELSHWICFWGICISWVSTVTYSGYICLCVL